MSQWRKAKTEREVVRALSKGRAVRIRDIDGTFMISLTTNAAYIRYGVTEGRIQIGPAANL